MDPARGSADHRLSATVAIINPMPAGDPKHPLPNCVLAYPAHPMNHVHLRDRDDTLTPCPALPAAAVLSPVEPGSADVGDAVPCRAGQGVEDRLVVGTAGEDGGDPLGVVVVWRETHGRPRRDLDEDVLD